PDGADLGEVGRLRCRPARGAVAEELVRVVGAAAGVQQRGAARVVVERHTVLAPGGVPARPVAVPCIDELDVAGVEDEALLERADRDAAGIASVEEADVLLDAGTGRDP